jgi:lambda repressor-like predicted transcriptional regulator
MSPVLHETADAYEVEFRRVRAALVARGTSLAKWARQHGISRQHASLALRGKSFGPKAMAIRRQLLTLASGG